MALLKKSWSSSSPMKPAISDSISLYLSSSSDILGAEELTCNGGRELAGALVPSVALRPRGRGATSGGGGLVSEAIPRGLVAGGGGDITASSGSYGGLIGGGAGKLSASTISAASFTDTDAAVLGSGEGCRQEHQHRKTENTHKVIMQKQYEAKKNN